MGNELTHYKYLSNQTLVLPTELLQVGLFRNEAKQNAKIIQHSLSKQQYQLNNLFCDTVVETLLFSYMLISHQANELDKSSDKRPHIEPYERGSKLLKHLKLKGNYTILDIEKKLLRFEEKFISGYFCVGEQKVHIFKTFSVDVDDKELIFEFSREFIRYLNQKKHSLTFVQITDFLAVKRKNQTQLFLIFQSMRGINSAFLTKRYISDILGITKDVNKKLSVAMKSLSSKNAIDYTKEVCKSPSGHRVFSRFIINSFDPNFASKTRDGNTYTPITKTVEKNDTKASDWDRSLSNSKQLKAPVDERNSSHPTKSKVVDFSAFKAKKEREDSHKIPQSNEDLIEIDEFDYSFIISFSDCSDYSFKYENGKVSISSADEKDEGYIPINPKNMSRLKIKNIDL